MITPDLGPRVGTRVRIVGKGRGTGRTGTVTCVGPSQWGGVTAWMVRLDDGTRVAKRRHQISTTTA